LFTATPPIRTVPFSPMIVILVLYFLKEFLVPVLYRIATEMG